MVFWHMAHFHNAHQMFQEYMHTEQYQQLSHCIWPNVYMSWRFEYRVGSSGLGTLLCDGISNRRLSITERKATIGLGTVAILGACWTFITVHWCILNNTLQLTLYVNPSKTYRAIIRAGVPFGTSRTGCQVTCFWSKAIITVTFPVIYPSWYLNHLTDTIFNF